MLKQRLQVLVNPEQRRRLDREARRRGISVGAVVREAIDVALGGASRAQKQRAIEEMQAVKPGAPYHPPEELNRMIAAAIEDAGRLVPDPADPAERGERDG